MSVGEQEEEQGEQADPTEPDVAEHGARPAKGTEPGSTSTPLITSAGEEPDESQDRADGDEDPSRPCSRAAG